MAKNAVIGGLLALTIATSMTTGAWAGGFERGRADTDILYEDGNADLRFGGTYIVPSRSYETISGAKGHDGGIYENFFIPSVAAKVKLFDELSCAGTYTQPFGVNTKYGSQAQFWDAKNTLNPTSSAKFRSNEYGALCAVKLPVGPGNLYFLGGAFMQDFDYTEVTGLGTLHLEDKSQFGYRLGTAYDIPQYAMRGEVMFRSQIDHEADGDFSVTSAGAAYVKRLTGLGLPTGYRLTAAGAGSLPKSLKVSLQSGIAPGWLAYGSVEWMDWSVLPALNYTIKGLGPQQKVFNFRDGWTIQGGVAHQFTEAVAGTINLTWDRGTGTGADTMTDVWTLAAGTQIKMGPGTLRVGGGVSYLTAGKQRVANGAPFDATVNGDWAYGLSSSYMIKF